MKCNSQAYGSGAQVGVVLEGFVVGYEVVTDC